MIKSIPTGDVVTTGKWVVLFNFWWGLNDDRKWLRAVADFETEKEAQKFFDYCKKEQLVPTKRPRYNIIKE